MTRDEQRALIAAIMDNVKAALLKHADEWPAEWDGHELRELAYMAMVYERTDLMRRAYSRRRRAFAREWVNRNLY